MNRIRALALLALFACVPVLAAGTIDFSIQMTGTTAPSALCAAARLGDNFTGVDFGTCPTQPPPANDPNALNVIIGKFTSHACTNFQTATGQDFGSTFGEGVTVWPYHPSTGVSMTLPPHGRYYGGVINTGPNPGILPHYLKGDAYAGSCNPPLRATVGARVNVRVVGVGATPQPTGLCSKVGAFDGTPWIQLKFAGAPNTSHCLGQIGGLYRYIVENAGTTNIAALLTFN